MKNRILGITLACAMIVWLLAGCGGGSAVPSSDEGTGPTAGNDASSISSSWKVTCPWAPSGAAVMVSQKAATLSPNDFDSITLVPETIAGDAATDNTWVLDTQANDPDLVFVGEGLLSITAIIVPSKMQFTTEDDFVFVESLYSSIFPLSADADLSINTLDDLEAYLGQCANYYKNLRYPQVVVNDTTCADQLVSLLIQAGHRRIAGIFVYDNYQSIEQFQGTVAAMLKRGVEFQDDYVKWCVSHEAHDQRFARSIDRFLKGLPQCTAIVCCNYMIYRLVRSVLEAQGKQVPEDCSLAYFDYSSADWEEECVTCSVHQGRQIGTLVATRLMMMIQRKDCEDKNYTYVMKPKIHIGTSIRKIGSLIHPPQDWNLLTYVRLRAGAPWNSPQCARPFCLALSPCALPPVGADARLLDGDHLVAGLLHRLFQLLVGGGAADGGALALQVHAGGFAGEAVEGVADVLDAVLAHHAFDHDLLFHVGHSFILI